MKNKERTACFIEAVIAILILAVGLFLRMYFYAPYGEPVFGSTVVSEVQNAYMEMAKVTADRWTVPIGLGIHSLYVMLLHGLFLLFGNIWSVGIVFQIVLTVLAALMLYFAVRKGSGRIAANIILAYLCAFPLLIGGSLVYGAQMLYLLMLGICLYAVNGFVAEGRKTSNGLVKLGFLSVGVAVLLASLIYLGIGGAGLLLLIILLPVFCHKNGGVLPWIFISLLVEVFTGAGICGWIYLQGTYEGIGFMGALGEWIRVQAGNMLFELSTYIAGSVIVLYYATAFVCFIGRLIKDKMFYTVDGSVDDLFNITFDEEAVSVEEAVEEALTEEAQVEEPEMEPEPVVEQEPPVVFIENPLPLPKKHVKKRLDFAIEPSEEQMEYDLEVDENDTYDLE